MKDGTVGSVVGEAQFYGVVRPIMPGGRRGSGGLVGSAGAMWCSYL